MTSLKGAIGFFSNGGGVFKICLGTILDASETSYLTNKWPWIYLNNANSRNGLTIQCGESGNLEDNCTIVGGKHQFTAAVSPGEITIKGITFKNSSMSCIRGIGVSKPLSVIDCIFAENTDTQKSNKNAGTTNFESNSHSISFTRCKFVNNRHTSDDGKLTTLKMVQM